MKRSELFVLPSSISKLFLPNGTENPNVDNIDYYPRHLSPSQGNLHIINPNTSTLGEDSFGNLVAGWNANERNFNLVTDIVNNFPRHMLQNLVVIAGKDGTTIPVAGSYFTKMMDHEPGTIEPFSCLITDENGEIGNLAFNKFTIVDKGGSAFASDSSELKFKSTLSVGIDFDTNGEVVFDLSLPGINTGILFEKNGSLSANPLLLFDENNLLLQVGDTYFGSGLITTQIPLTIDGNEFQLLIGDVNAIAGGAGNPLYLDLNPSANYAEVRADTVRFRPRNNTHPEGGKLNYAMTVNGTSWGFGARIGTIRLSDNVANQGSILWDVGLIMIDGKNFSMSSNGANGFTHTTTGNDTLQAFVQTNTAGRSGSLALISFTAIGAANRSPTTVHVHPTLYLYANGSTNANHFTRMFHDGSNGTIETGTGSLILKGASGVHIDSTTYGIGIAPTAVQTGYTTFTNLTTDRTCDADATSVAELADILGTLIVDLKTKGIIA